MPGIEARFGEGYEAGGHVALYWYSILSGTHPSMCEWEKQPSGLSFLDVDHGPEVYH